MAQAKEPIASSNVDEMFKKYQQRITEFEDEICEFPVDNNRIISEEFNQFKPQIYEHMKSCYPLVHGSVLSLANDFLLIKKQFGTEIEKKVYSQMSLCQFFDRLATKRCVVFYQSYDSYLLRNGYNDSGHWEYVGTPNEQKQDKYDVTPLKKPKLSEYLSYDELMISALCGISSKTHFINNGDRRNCGRVNKNNEYYPAEAIYMGLVGARFEKSGFMEHALMAVTPQQNTIENGYGPHQEDNEEKKEKGNDENETILSKANKTAKIEYSKVIWRAFESFYGRSHFPKYDEVVANEEVMIQSRYYKKQLWANNDHCPFLDKDLFRQRIRIGLELFLFDADHRAQEATKTKKTKGAYCHIVGLGTGVWSFKKSIQDEIIVCVALDIIKQTNLPNIQIIYFSWLSESHNAYPDNSMCEDISGHKIHIKHGKRAPADKLEEPFENCLTVAMYAWDSNAFPGNEYYHGMLSASGDPAAASASTISFVQNSMINQEHINGKNTMVYFYNAETHKYEFHKLGDIDFQQNKQKWLRKSRDSKR
eukprot:103579_1